MAILQKIRNRAGIFVLIFVGVALILFVIDPSTFDALFRKNPTDIAKINGENVSYEEYVQISNMHEEWLKVAQRTTNLDTETMNAIREQSWNDIIRKYLVEIGLEDMGIRVSDEEIEDMLWGNHIHSIIQQNFTNPETNMLDTAVVQQYFTNADQDPSGQQVFVTNYLKKMIVQDRLITKYNTTLAKGLYVPKFIAEDDYFSKANKVNFVMVTKNYKEIPDEDITVTDSDIEDYYNKHIERFQIEENNRDIEYVLFEVLPSGEDTAQVINALTQLRPQLETSETPKILVNQNSDQAFMEQFVKKSELSFELQAEFFDAEIGSVSDIYFNNGSYNISLLLERRELPDSVKASHILIIPDSIVSIEAARNIIDSLENLVNGGADFAALAAQFSQDPGNNTKGGDLGWFVYGRMVKPFNDACFNNKVGHVERVETQFGVHLLKIEEQAEYAEMISLATVSKQVNYSTNTYQKYYADASTFAANNNSAKSFDKAVVENQMVKRIASSIKENDIEIKGLTYPREIIRWVYSEDLAKGQISPVFELEAIFVVAKVTAIREKGDADVEDVRSDIEPVVIQKKKAEKIIAEFNENIKQGFSLEKIASTNNLMIDTARNISFNTFSLPRQGIEPNIIASATLLAKDVVSKPIEGNNGVYIIKVIEKTEAPPKEDYSSDQLTLISSLSSRASYQAFEALKKKAEIEDMRSTWF